MTDAEEGKHFVYILKCADGSLYTGYATDVERRVREHNGLEPKAGAKYTAGRRPVALVYQESFETRGEAMSREAKIKQLTRKEKEGLISS
jgi:putative endonuclease